MKFLRILLLICSFSNWVAAQETEDPNWLNVVGPTLEESVEALGQAPVASATGNAAAMQMALPPASNLSSGNSEPTLPEVSSLTTPTPIVGGNLADEITPEIASLARGLRYDPVLIYAFVRNHVDFDPYYGSKKGANLTLLEMSGNDMDQSALLVALLRASGYSPSYRSGPVAFFPTQHVLWNGISNRPYDHMTDAQFAAAIGTTVSDPQLANERIYYGLVAYLAKFGYPIVERVNVGGYRAFGIPHVWVQVAINGTTYQLSPSYKQYDWLSGIDIVAATNFSKSQILTDAAPETDPTDPNGVNWVSKLKYQAISNRLSTYTTNFINYIRANEDTLPVEDLFPRKHLVQKPILTLADADPIIPYTSPWATSETWTATAIPTNRMSKIAIKAGTAPAFTSPLFNQTVDLPALKGRKLSLAFSGNTATFRLDEATLGSAFTLANGSTTSVQLAITHDHYTWAYNTTTSAYVKTDTVRSNQTVTQTYKNASTGAYTYAYAFPYSYDNPAKLIRARQEVLARYKREGVADTDWRVQTETLNIMGLEWYSQTWRAHQVFSSLSAGVTLFAHRFGRVAQEDSYYIDVMGQGSASQNRALNDIYTRNIDQIGALYMSAMEHGVLEQLQGQAAEAVSTVKVIYQANVLNQRIYRAKSSNWSSISSQFTGYENLPSIATAVSNGAVALLPKSGSTALGPWSGEGYAIEGVGLTQMKISRDLNGGFSIYPGPAGTNTIIFWGNSDPAYDSSAGNVLDVPYTPHTTPKQASIDPVDLLSGAYFMDRTDLSLAGSGSRGLDLSRSYNSHRRHDGSAGLGFGWTHGNHIRLVERSSTGAALGETNTYQAAAFVVAALASSSLHFEHTTAKEWATSALIAQWGVQQLEYNSAAVSIGNKTFEFIKLPDGSFVPPPGQSMTLVKNGDGSYDLTKRNDITIHFDSSGKATTLTDPDTSQKTFSYTGDQLNTVTDEYARTLTYTWTSGRISSVTDGSRTVSFGYTSGNMMSFIDAENKTWSYHYDTERRMDWLKDPESRLIAENDYDAENRIVRQRSMGDVNREWEYTWSGFLNVEENPNGELNAYAYDERGRSVVVANHLSEASSIAYDGQDRIFSTTTPKDETTYNVWNADNNLDGTIDPLFKTTACIYDSAKRLEHFWDKRGKKTSYTYTTAHKIKTITDPLLHTTTYGYYPNGLLQEVIDAEQKKTSFEYDSWGLVNKITDHDQKIRGFTNSNRGDVLTATDGEQRTVTNTYNNRGQLLTSTLPAVPNEPASVVTNTYDDSGNLKDTTDAKNHLTGFTYNAIGGNKTTTLPILPTGGNVITNTYDFRDWLQTTYNSLSHTVTTEWDAAHRVFAVIDPLTRRTEFTHDANGRVTEAKDALLRITKQRWTARGEKERDTDALDKFSTSLYDNNGNLTDYTNRRNKLYKSFYDDANRLEWSKTPSLKTTLMTYYDNNLVETIKEPSTQITTFLYNGRNLVETKTDSIGAIGYLYDDSNLLKTVTEGSTTIGRTYDERGNLKTFTTADGDLIQYKYDANGNVRRITYPDDTPADPNDNKQVNYTYNSRNLLETVTDWRNKTTTYVYDRLGRLTDVQRPNQTVLTIAHDDAGQIQNLRERRNGTLFNYQQFRYDDAGQIKHRFQAPMVNSGWQHPTFAATYDDDNRLATVNSQTVTHDPDGNLTYGPISPSSGNLTLVYNTRNQLTNAGNLTYSYDAEGRRRTITDSSDATGNTRDVIDVGGKLLIRIHPDLTKTYYVYGLGLLYEVDEADHAKTYHFDQVGSTIARTDDDGNVIGRASYSAYGLITLKNGDMTTPFLFNGQAGVQTDSNGLLNMRARYYSPYLMRFLNADPIGFSGGPNWFAYADGNPISLFDPFGLCAESGWSRAGQFAKDFGQGLLDYTWTDLGNDTLGVTRGLGQKFPILAEMEDFVGEVNRNMPLEALGPNPGMFFEGAGLLLGRGVQAAASNKGGNLYRVVDDFELADIQKAGQFRTAPGSFEGKQFVDNLDDAQALQKRFSDFFGGNQTIVRGQAPQSVLDNASRVPFSDIPNGTAITIPPADLLKVIPNH